jgi:hypothetical protein
MSADFTARECESLAKNKEYIKFKLSRHIDKI